MHLENMTTEDLKDIVQNNDDEHLVLWLREEQRHIKDLKSAVESYDEYFDQKQHH